METRTSYETKVILIAIANIIRKSGSLREVYDAIEATANAEGIVVRPWKNDSAD